MNDLCRANTARQLFLVEELRRLLGLLDSAGIPAIPLKGPWLAQRLYGDYTLRVCSDLDVLVRPEHVVPAARALRDLGYEPPCPMSVLRKYLKASMVEIPLSSPRCTLELHWRVVRGGATDKETVDSIWETARVVDLWGSPAWVMSREWELLYLTIHAIKHGWGTLKWTADLADAVADPELDRASLAALAANLGLGWVASEAERVSAVHSAAGRVQPLGSLASAYSTAQLIQGKAARLRFWADLVFMPTEADFCDFGLSESLAWLYPLVRPLRLSCKWAWRFLGALVPRDRRLEPGLRAGQARSAFASAWKSLAVKVHDLTAYCLRPTAFRPDLGPWTLDLGRWTLALAPNVILRNARRFPRAPAALLYLLIGLLCILSLRATSSAAPVSLTVQARPEARLDQGGSSFDLTIELPALELGVQ